LPTDIRPGWQWQTLAWCITSTFTTVKGFIVQVLMTNIQLCLGVSAEEKNSFVTRNFRLTKREKPRSGGRKRRSSKKRFPCRPQTCQVSGNNNIFVQLFFSSNVTSDTVTLTNYVKNLNFCGRLYSDSLVAKPLSDLYFDNCSNFQSNDW